MSRTANGHEFRGVETLVLHTRLVERLARSAPGRRRWITRDEVGEFVLILAFGVLAPLCAVSVYAGSGAPVVGSLTVLTAMVVAANIQLARRRPACERFVATLPAKAEFSEVHPAPSLAHRLRSIRTRRLSPTASGTLRRPAR